MADERGRAVLLLKLKAAPVDGKANAELVRFLADSLGCPRADVALLRGQTSRLKSLSVPLEKWEALQRSDARWVEPGEKR